MLAVDRHERHFARPGSGGEDDVGRPRTPYHPVDVDPPGGREASRSGDEVDVVLLEQARRATWSRPRPASVRRSFRDSDGFLRAFESVLLGIGCSSRRPGRSSGGALVRCSPS